MTVVAAAALSSLALLFAGVSSSQAQSADAETLTAPLEPGQPEPVEEMTQPNWNRDPVFVDYFKGTYRPRSGADPAIGDYFGPAIGGFSLNPDISVAYGDGRVYVTAEETYEPITEAVLPGALYTFDADTMQLIDETSLYRHGQEAQIDPVGVTYYRGLVYVSADAGGSNVQIQVFDRNGDPVKRRDFSLTDLPPDVAIEGIDAAWGEVWVIVEGLYDSQAPRLPHGTRAVAVFEAESLRFKGLIPTYTEGHVADGSVETQSRLRDDIALGPEADAAVSQQHVISRNPLLSTASLPDLPAIYAILDGDPWPTSLYTFWSGVDWAWGMRAVNAVDMRGNVTDFSYEGDLTSQDRLLRGGLVARRSWRLNSPPDYGSADVAYRNREPRIDWSGSLTQGDWLNGSQSLSYIVSKADIYAVGSEATITLPGPDFRWANRGERWYELADVTRMELRVDGVLKATNASAQGTFPLDTNTIPSGEHELTLTAVLSDGSNLVKSTNLRVDHDVPAVTWSGPGQYVRGQVSASGTATDSHSGPRDFALEIAPSGGGWQTVCSDGSFGPTGEASCEWNTQQTPDGSYEVRARVRDRVDSQAPNVAYTPIATTLVDNTAPSFSDPAPGFGSGYGTSVRRGTEVLFRHSDAGSGVDQTHVEYNTATDGSSSGQWQRADATPAGPGQEPDGAASVEWSASADPGLHRVRATTRDRAGNQRQTEWQVAVRQELQGNCLDTTYDSRCYAGTAAGQGWEGGLRAYKGQGARARVTPPAAVAPPNTGGFSYLGMAMTAANQDFPGDLSIEGGPIDDCLAPWGERSTNVSRAWTAHMSYWDGTGQSASGTGFASQCFEDVSVPGSLAPVTYEYQLFRPKRSGNPTFRYGTYTATINYGENYWAKKYGEDIVFFGESSQYGRYLEGQYANARFYSHTEDRWRPPLNVASLDDPYPQYQSRYLPDGSGGADPSYFCVEGPGVRCTKPERPN